MMKNHAFLPSCLDSAYRIWACNCIHSVKDLYEESMFTSFPSLSARFNLPNSHLFSFFQTRHFVQKLFPHLPNRHPEHALDSFFDLKPNDKHLISVIYNLINTLIPNLSKRFKEIWAFGNRKTFPFPFQMNSGHTSYIGCTHLQSAQGMV